MNRVMIEPANYQDCLLAVQKAFELFKPQVKGQKVLVKPNVLRLGTPEEAITTHPAVLSAVLRCLEERGAAQIIVGDNPGVVSYGANEAAFAAAGLLEAAGPYYRNLGQDSVEVDFDPAYMAKVSVSRAVLEADLIISMPKFKTHGLTVITAAIKNSYGILPGAQKALLHRLSGGPAAFHRLVVDVFKLRVPDFYIMDAVLGMQGNGPASTDLRWVGRVLAADNAVAMDAVVARMMGLEPARIGFLERAQELGLGSLREDDIEIIGQLQTLADFRVPPMGGEALLHNPVMQDLLHSRALMRPQADPQRCTACGTCLEQCPMGALSMPEDLPQVDSDLCIACFCCQEMCPEKAITLR